MLTWSRLTRWIIDHPRFLIIGIATITVYLGFWATKVKTDHRAGHFLASDSDVVRNFERFADTFEESQTLLYVVFGSQDTFSSRFLDQTDSLTRYISKMTGVDRVLSLTNYPFLERVGDTLISKPLYEADLNSDSLRTLFQSQPLLRGLLLSNDGEGSAMVVDIDDEFNNTSDRVLLVRSIEEMVETAVGDVAMAGFPYLRSKYAERVTAEAPLFTFLSLGISLGLLFITFRARRAVTLPTLVVALGITWTIGFVALMDHRLNIVTSVLPALLVIIGMANSIHLITKFYDRYVELGDRHEALIQTMSIVGLATFLTSLTTAIGFLVLMLSGSQLLSVFGQYAALGIMVLYLLSITIIPLAFSILKPPAHGASLATHAGMTSFFDAIGRFTEKHSGAIILVSLAVLGVGVVGASRISSDIYIFSDFYDDDPLRIDLSTFESAYGGVLPMEVVIESKKEGQFRTLGNARRLDRLQSKLAELDYVGNTISAADMLKAVNQSFYNGRQEAFRLPSSSEMSFIQSALGKLNSGESASMLASNLPSFVDSTFSITRVYLGVEDIGTTRMNALADTALAFAREIFSEERYSTYVTGTAVKATKSGENLVSNLAISLLVALVVISLLMAFLFKSGRLTLISLAPNILPLILVGGAMGFAGILLKQSTALIFPLAFGIAVDDTIHFLAKYRLVRQRGTTKNEAILITLRETGKAILFTSLVLMFGFLMFTLSSFGGTVNLGAFTALTLTVALLANLFLLPALLFRYGPETSNDSRT